MQIAASPYIISTYPGSYTPIQFTMKTPATVSKSHQGTKNPPCNICETNEYYKIELAVPGWRRDELFAGINNEGYLIVSAHHHNTPEQAKGKYRKHAFNDNDFSRQLILPQKVNSDFIKAEYGDGILSFWFLKTKKPYQKQPSVIVIY